MDCLTVSLGKSWLVGLSWPSNGNKSISHFGGFGCFVVVFVYGNSPVFKWLQAPSSVTMTHQLEKCVSSGWEESFKFIIHLLRYSSIKAHTSCVVFPFCDIMAFSLFSHALCMHVHIYKYEIRKCSLCSHKEHFNGFMRRLEHVFLYFIVICLAVLKCGESMKTKNECMHFVSPYL